MIVVHDVKLLVSTLGYDYLGHIRQVKFWNQFGSIYWKCSIDLQSDQLTGFYMIQVFTESYFKTDYSIVQVFFKDMLIFKKQSNVGSLKII